MNYNNKQLIGAMIVAGWDAQHGGQVCWPCWQQNVVPAAGALTVPPYLPACLGHVKVRASCLDRAAPFDHCSLHRQPLIKAVPMVVVRERDGKL